MVDDSSKFTRKRQAGQRSPEGSDPPINDPASVLSLLDARLKLASSGVENNGLPKTKAPVSAQALRTASTQEAVELTPPPMVISDSGNSLRLGAGLGDGTERTLRPSPDLPLTRDMPVVERSSGNKGALRATPTEERITEPPISYHPPRRPPVSVIPPAPDASFSVAPEYDPRAPTKPRVRRVSARPPAPLLFGLDRMLVWGMVFGGVFVAAIVVLVHRLAPTESNSGKGRNRVRNVEAIVSPKPSIETVTISAPTVPAVPSTIPSITDAGVAIKRGSAPSASTLVRPRSVGSPQVIKQPTDERPTILD